MGAWGTGYNENDNYHDGVEVFNDLLLSALLPPLKVGLVKAQKQPSFSTDFSGDSAYSTGEFRAQLMMTFYALRSIDGMTLSPDELHQMQKAVEQVRSAVEDASEDWGDPSEFKESVESEMQEVADWLATFREEESFGARIHQIVEKFGWPKTPGGEALRHGITDRYEMDRKAGTVKRFKVVNGVSTEVGRPETGK